jgi:hypothetical protein
VGAWEDSQFNTNGFLLSSNGTFTNIDVPGSGITQPQGINDSGTIIGYYVLHGGNWASGFVYSSGVFTTLDYPGSIQTQLLGINDAGDIVGQYVDTSENFYAFLATPAVAPEPSFLPVVAPTAIALVCWRFRRRRSSAKEFQPPGRP